MDFAPACREWQNGMNRFGIQWEFTPLVTVPRIEFRQNFSLILVVTMGLLQVAVVFFSPCHGSLRKGNVGAYLLCDVMKLDPSDLP